MKKIYILLLLIYTSNAFILSLNKYPNKLKIKNSIIRKNPITICNLKKTNNIIKKNIKLYDVELTSDILAIALVYFVQGIIGLSSLAITFYYKDKLNLEPSELSFLGSITTIPWIIKPLYGFISDTFPLFGYKRKSYLILSGLLSSSSWLSMSYLVNNNNNNIKYISILLLTLSSLGIAFSDVLVDAIVVTKSKNKKLSGSLQSICWTSSSCGSIISSYSSGFLLEKYGISWIFGLTALFPLITALVGLYIKDEKIINNNKKIYIDKYKEQLNNIIKSFKNEKIIHPLLFMFLWQATPSSGNSLFYFETNILNFNPEFFGKLSLVSSISSVIGIYI